MPELCGRDKVVSVMWHVHELFIAMRREHHYPWSEVDQDGDVHLNFLEGNSTTIP